MGLSTNTKAVRKCSGKEVEGRPSSFWFEKEHLLLAAYVDNLMLSGPSEKRTGVWSNLKQHIDLEGPEPLSSFLGRTHADAANCSFSTGKETHFGMREYCAQTVEL